MKPKVELNLKDIFSQCHRLEDYVEPELEEFKLDEAQRKEIAQFLWRMEGVTGLTLDDGVRYLTNGAVLINSFAIVQMDAWQVFRQIFEGLGDSWHIGRWSSTAAKVKIQSPLDSLNQGIESWSEDLEEMELLSTIDGFSVLKNSNGQPVLVNADFFEFLNNYLCFSLNDCPTPTSPITLTHCHSLGFAGLVMPLELTGETNQSVISKLESALNLLKGGDANE